MPKYFMRTYGQSGGFGEAYSADLDTAVLDVTPELLALCRQRERLVLELAAHDENLWELLFWDPGGVTYFAFSPQHLVEQLGLTASEDAADEGQLVELTDPAWLEKEKESEAGSVECIQMRVLVERSNGSLPHCTFGWGAYPKHQDVWVTTPTFTLEYLEKLPALAAAP